MEEKLMREALRQAKKAAAIGETPIGAVIVRDGGKMRCSTQNALQLTAPVKSLAAGGCRAANYT